MIRKLVISLFFTGSLFIYAGEEHTNIQKRYEQSYRHEQIGKLDDAIKILIPLYQKYPKGYTLNLRLGWLFFLKRNYMNAIQYYKKASLIKPYAIEPKLGLVRVYLAINDYQKSQTLINEILRTDFYNYYGNLYAIEALIGEKKYNIALEITRKMLTLYPTDITFLEMLARIYKETNSSYLNEVYQDILTLDPHNTLIKEVNP